MPVVYRQKYLLEFISLNKNIQASNYPWPGPNKHETNWSIYERLRNNKTTHIIKEHFDFMLYSCFSTSWNRLDITYTINKITEEHIKSGGEVEEYKHNSRI